jgi:hypothetical protein
LDQPFGPNFPPFVPESLASNGWYAKNCSMPNNNSKPFAKVVLTLGLLVTSTWGTVFAQTNNSTITIPPVAGPGLLNDWLRQESAEFNSWDIGGQVRGRYENKAYFAVPNLKKADFLKGGVSGNEYELMRERFHLGWLPVGWFEIYGELQDATSWNDQRQPSPDNDHYTLRQAWVAFGNPDLFPLKAKVGRQELIYGDQRFIGVADWLNFGRVYDAAKLRYVTSNFWVDAFVSQPVLPDLHGFDTSDSHDKFSGLYASTRTLVPFQETQLYFLARNTDGHPAYEAAEKPVQYVPASPRDIYTVGTRVASLPGKLNGWDYTLEALYQFGRFESSTTTPSMTQDAFAAHLAGGYTWTQTGPLSPRVGLEYNYGSGDSNAKDGTHGTLDNLFPSQHGLYGIMDFFSLQNVQDLRLSTSVKVLKPLTLSLDGYAFWLATTSDYFYQAIGAPRTTGGYGIHPGYNPFVGTELDLVATWAITGYASLQGGYAHFFAGDYIRDSLSGHGGSTDADYFYAQVTFSF